jgi:hypothetical protein
MTEGSTMTIPAALLVESRPHAQTDDAVVASPAFEEV